MRISPQTSREIVNSPGPFTQLDLPPMPPLDAELVGAHDEAHAALALAIRDAGDVVRRSFRYIQWRLMAEAMASVQPPSPECEPQLVPARRRHLSMSQQRRLEGCIAALRHFDSRVAMRASGAIPHVIESESPMVVHGLVETGDPHRRISNAGCIRATPSRFDTNGVLFVPAPPEHCRRLLLDAVTLAHEAPAPAITRAAWLLAAVFAVHPFVDGNGRVGRLLCHGLISEESPCGIDWGTAPEFAARRHAYIAAASTMTLPSLPSYDARRLEPVHLMRYVARCSARGAHRACERLHALAKVAGRLLDAGLDDERALVIVAVAADRNGRLADLGELFGDQAAATALVNELVVDGRLAWDQAGLLQLVGDNPFTTSG